MSASLISPSGTVLHHRARCSTTPADQAEAKAVRIRLMKESRLEENRIYLKNRNVTAFLRAICETTAGGVDFLVGATRGRRNDPRRFTNFSTHPGSGLGGGGTAAGSYQITLETWVERAGAMGLSDFGPETQDLIAVDILRGLGALDRILAGDLIGAVSAAARHWGRLPAIGEAAPDQACVAAYAAFEAHYRAGMGEVDTMLDALSFPGPGASVAGSAD